MSSTYPFNPALDLRFEPAVDLPGALVRTLKQAGPPC